MTVCDRCRDPNTPAVLVRFEAVKPNLDNGRIKPELFYSKEMELCVACTKDVWGAAAQAALSEVAQPSGEKVN